MTESFWIGTSIVLGVSTLMTLFRALDAERALRKAKIQASVDKAHADRLRMFLEQKTHHDFDPALENIARCADEAGIEREELHSFLIKFIERVRDGRE